MASSLSSSLGACRFGWDGVSCVVPAAPTPPHARRERTRATCSPPRRSNTSPRTHSCVHRFIMVSLARTMRAPFPPLILQEDYHVRRTARLRNSTTTEPPARLRRTRRTASTTPARTSTTSCPSSTSPVRLLSGARLCASMVTSCLLLQTRTFLPLRWALSPSRLAAPPLLEVSSCRSSPLNIPVTSRPPFWRTVMMAMNEVSDGPMAPICGVSRQFSSHRAGQRRSLPRQLLPHRHAAQLVRATILPLYHDGRGQHDRLDGEGRVPFLITPRSTHRTFVGDSLRRIRTATSTVRTTPRRARVRRASRLRRTAAPRFATATSTSRT